MIKYCYLLKIKTKGHKINILIQIKGIEGYPFITRFKTFVFKLLILRKK